jgi:ABC-type transport system involved in cytochrome c biogenesis permease subunit
MQIDSTFFFYFSVVGYFAAFICYLMHLTGRKRTEALAAESTPSHPEAGGRWGRTATWITFGAVAFATVGIVFRTVELSRVSDWFIPLPVSNTYETLAFFAWTIPLLYLVFERRYKTQALGAVITGLAFLLIVIASSPLVPQAVTPLVPALQSYWLVAHVFFTLIGEALFSVAFAAAVIMLWKVKRGASIESLRRFEDISYRAVALGFPLFTLGGLVFGAIWAQNAWGRYWGWDPKETWMLISWFIYAIYLHVRVRWGRDDLRSTWLIVIGYLATIFTWFGVNYLLSGLHSYG